MTTKKPTYQELEKELKLLKSEEITKPYLEFDDNLLIELDTKGIVTHVNKKVCEVLSYKEEEIIGKNWFDNFLPKKIKSTVFSLSQKLLNGEQEGTKNNENSILTKNGDERIIKWHNAVIRNQKGLITGHLSCGEDITEIKKVEIKLSEAHSIIERSPAVVFLWKAGENWPVEYVSNNVQQMFGYTAEDFLNDKTNYLELIYPEDLSVVSEEVKKFSENNSIEFEHKPYRIIAKSGEIKWVKDRTQIRRNNEGEITHYEGVLLDVTKNKEREYELIKLNEAIKNSLHEVYIFNTDDLKITFANEVAIKKLGYTFEELKEMTPVNITPEFSREQAIKKLTPLKRGEIDKLNFKTFRQRKDKSLYPVEISVSKFKIEDKFHFLALVIDITERNKSKEALIESEANLNAFTNQSSEGISVADLKGNYTFVNPAFCEMVGYTEKELLKMTVFDVTADTKDTSTFKKSITIEEGEPVIVELIRKDGSTFIAEVTGKNLIIKGKKRVLGTIRNITEREKFKQKLIESEYLLTEAQKISEIGSYTLDIESGFWTSSLALDNLFGIDKDYKRDIAGWLNIIQPKDRLALKEYLTNNIVKNHEFFDREYRIQRINDKQERWLHGLGKLEFSKEGKPIRMLGTIQDITNRKRIEETLVQNQKVLQNQNFQIKESNIKLIESNNRFKNLFENSPISLWEEDISEVLILINKKAKEVDNLKLYLDENPQFVSECASKVKILNVNKSALKLLEINSKEELTANLSENFNSKSFETFKEELLILTTKDKVFKGETEFIRSDGEIVFVTLELVIVEKNRVIVSFSNITELKKAKEKAEESNLLKTEFINNMSHEIRTPMNGIMGFSEFLADPNLSDKKRITFVNIIRNSGLQLLQIIDDILEISRLGTKQVKVFEEPVNLNDLLFELFSIFEDKAKENKTPLYLENELINIKSVILTDKYKLNKILSNLLENALKFTNVGFIEFGYKLLQHNKQTQLEIYVKDTGKGINKEDQELIFERFSQAEKDTTNKAQGLGLGLSIAKENTELLGGVISVESIKRKGTTFFVRIPYKPVFNDEDIQEDLKEKKCILIVEDEEINYLYLSTIIEDVLKINCTILHAKNGKEAVHICNNNTTINIVLMDLKMPEMDGFDATKEIKKMNPNIPIIAQTAYSTKLEIEKAMDAGCDDFISKPISKDALFNCITKFVPNL